MTRHRHTGVLILVSAALLSTQATAEDLVWVWLNPCPGGIDWNDCYSGPGQHGPSSPGTAWCASDWDSSGSWESLCEFNPPLPPACPDHDWPEETTDHALIERSNTYICNGGPKDGQGCDLGSPTDCRPGGTCKGICCGGSNEGDPCASHNDCPDAKCAREKWLEVNLTTETIGDLYIATEPTNADTDSLDIRFKSQDGGGNTLTVNMLTIDAQEGAMTVQAKGQTTLQTD